MLPEFIAWSFLILLGLYSFCDYMASVSCYEDEMRDRAMLKSITNDTYEPKSTYVSRRSEDITTVPAIISLM